VSANRGAQGEPRTVVQIVEAWGLARRIEDFLSNALTTAANLDGDARERSKSGCAARGSSGRGRRLERLRPDKYGMGDESSVGSAGEAIPDLLQESGDRVSRRLTPHEAVRLPCCVYAHDQRYILRLIERLQHGYG
jgi:hypothetical protein